MTASRLVLTAALLAYGAVVVPSGLDRISRNAPALERAVPGPFRSQADRSAASTALVRKQADAAVKYGRAAVRHDPVDPDSTALLGSGFLQAGKYDEADRAFRVAARFGWRNPSTQAYWLDAALQAQDFDHAVDRADAILRAHPRLADQHQLLAPFEESPAGRHVLAKRLESRPPWLGQYVRVTSKLPAQTIEQRYQVISQMDANPPLGCDVVAPLVQGLLQLGRHPEAQGLWNRQCPDRTITGFLGDPTFSFIVSDNRQVMPFSWTAWRTGDVGFRRDGSEDKDSLLLVTNSASSARVVLYQPVALPAGRYVVRINGSTANSPASKLTASFGCGGRFPLVARPEGNVLAEGQTIVATACTDQQLGLWLSGDNSSVHLRSIELKPAN